MSMQIIFTLAGYFVFSAAVGAMIEPTEEQRRGFYGWLFRFLQALAANAAAVAKARFGSALPTLSGNTETAAASAISTTTTERRIEVAASSATQ